MDAERWWAFAATVFVIAGTPGPNMLHVMARSVQLGFARSIWAMAGCLSAVVLALAASAFGVGALLAAMPRLFDALRWAGAAYLLWLGIRAWRAGKGGAGADPDGAPRRPASAPILYRDALLTGLSNPKLILFAAALFPQFVDRRAPAAGQFAILVATFAAIEGGWYCVYAGGGRRLARWLRSPGRRRAFDRATGSLFVLFALGLAVARV